MLFILRLNELLLLGLLRMLGNKVWLLVLLRRNVTVAVLRMLLGEDRLRRCIDGTLLLLGLGWLLLLELVPLLHLIVLQ